MVYPAAALADWAASLKDRKVVVLGGGRSGLAAAKALLKLGAKPFLSDKAALDPTTEAQLQTLGIPSEGGGHSTDLLDDAAMVVPSPGIPMEAPMLTSAREQGIPLMGEIELAYRLSRSPMVAITGSNGKTTTTSLTAAILEAQGFQTGCGGNIGIPLVSLTDTKWDVLVAEISTFQLETVEALKPAVALLVNLYDNHLDRHGSRDVYFGLKAKLFANQDPSDWAVYNADQPEVQRYAASFPGKHFPFSRLQSLTNGACLEDDWVVVRVDGVSHRILPVADIPLPGDHNVENVLAACASCWRWGGDIAKMADAIRAFAGVTHRLEKVRQLDGLTWVNDSKATNYEAARRAITSFDRPLVWIGGGRDKGGDFTPLTEAIVGRVHHAVLVGEAGPAFAERLAAAGYTSVTVVGTLKEATQTARQIGRPGDVVLFSPACTSFDQFRNFEERGDVYKALVQAL